MEPMQEDLGEVVVTNSNRLTTAALGKRIDVLINATRKKGMVPFVGGLKAVHVLDAIVLYAVEKLTPDTMSRLQEMFGRTSVEDIEAWIMEKAVKLGGIWEAKEMGEMKAGTRNTFLKPIKAKFFTDGEKHGCSDAVRYFIVKLFDATRQSRANTAERKKHFASDMLDGYRRFRDGHGKGQPWINKRVCLSGANLGKLFIGANTLQDVLNLDDLELDPGTASESDLAMPVFVQPETAVNLSDEFSCGTTNKSEIKAQLSTLLNQKEIRIKSLQDAIKVEQNAMTDISKMIVDLENEIALETAIQDAKNEEAVRKVLEKEDKDDVIEFLKFRDAGAEALKDFTVEELKEFAKKPAEWWEQNFMFEEACNQNNEKDTLNDC